MKYIIALMLLLIPVTSHAIDKKIVSNNEFKIGIFSSSQKGGGLAGLDVTAPYSDFAIKIQCGAGTIITVDETGDVIGDEGGGYYILITNDTFTAVNEAECLIWVEGESNYAGLIAKTPVKFKAVAIVDGQYSGVVVSSADCTNSQTVFDTDLTQSQTDHWKDSFLTFTSGTLVGQTKAVTAFNGTTKCVTVKGGFSTTPTATDTFILINK